MRKVFPKEKTILFCLSGHGLMDLAGYDKYLNGELKEAALSEEFLRKSLEVREKRFQYAFAYAPIGMALVSLSGSWLKVNLSLCKLFGYNLL